METTPRFINGVYDFTGTGLGSAASLAGLGYIVPADKRAQMIYFRGGNATDELIVVIMVHNGKPVRLFPIGAKASVHVPLAVVEDLEPESRIEIFVAAPAGHAGQVVLDIGLLEI